MSRRRVGGGNTGTIDVPRCNFRCRRKTRGGMVRWKEVWVGLRTGQNVRMGPTGRRTFRIVWCGTIISHPSVRLRTSTTHPFRGPLGRVYLLFFVAFDIVLYTEVRGRGMTGIVQRRWFPPVPGRGGVCPGILHFGRPFFPFSIYSLLFPIGDFCRTLGIPGPTLLYLVPEANLQTTRGVRTFISFLKLREVLRTL